ncbi:GAPC1 [Symbiodinium natans]|uniref:GAPC1 protein n=1 Tax=Symbiodinium natans TaxID=878477 RepID=A0A812UJE0_9DINO|nr:GAPC1 [Symbiodinium natans]
MADEKEAPSPSSNPRLLQSVVVINARGTRITTTGATLGRLALPGTFFGSFDWGAQEPEEIFLDHDPAAVAAVLTSFANVRFGMPEALGAIRHASTQCAYALRPLLHFLGLEWLNGQHFASCFDDAQTCAACKCGEELARDCWSLCPGDLLQHLVEVSGKSSWTQLPELALLDEQVELYGVGDEAFLLEQGGFVPMGEARCWDVPGEGDGQWFAAPQTRILVDLGASRAVWPTGLKMTLLVPDLLPTTDAFILDIRLDAVSEFQEPPQLLASAIFRIRGRESAANSTFLVDLPVASHRQGAFRMLRLSTTLQDRRLGCVSLQIYGDLFQNLPSELRAFPRDTFVFSSEYSKYERVSKGKTPYHGSAGFYQEWI